LVSVRKEEGFAVSPEYAATDGSRAMTDPVDPMQQLCETYPTLCRLLVHTANTSNELSKLQCLQMLGSLGFKTPSCYALKQVQAALANTTLVPVGSDPTTRNDGLFKDRCSVLTAANCHEASMAMIRLATGLSVDAVTSLLYESAGLTLDILTHKEAPNVKPKMGQLRKDSKAMVTALISIVMDRDDKTVVALFMGWLNDLLVQWSFNTEEIAYQALVKKNGTNVLGAHGIEHSEGVAPGDMVSSRTLRATYRGDNVRHVHLLKEGIRVRTLTVCVLGHGSGSGAGQHQATVELDALGFARAVVDQPMMASIDIDIEKFGF